MTSHDCHDDAVGPGTVEAYLAAQQEKDRLVEGLLHRIFLFLQAGISRRLCFELF